MHVISFKVPWPKDDWLGDELFPHIDNSCGDNACELQDDWTCLCDVMVDNYMAYNSSSLPPADAAEIRSTLKIGAFPPDYLGNYGNGIDIGGGVTVYHSTDTNDYSVDSIFKIADLYDEFVDFGEEYVLNPQGPQVEGVLYLKNLISTIHIGDVASEYFAPPARKPLRMRNPLMFHNLVKPAIRDSHYEVDAVIHHLTSHPNAAPFVSR